MRGARRRRSHRWTAPGKARPEPLRLGERLDAGWERPAAGPYLPGLARSCGHRDGGPSRGGCYTRHPAHALGPGLLELRAPALSEGAGVALAAPSPSGGRGPLAGM